MLIKRILFLCCLASVCQISAQKPVYGFPDNFSSVYYNYGDLEPGVDCLKDQVIIKIKPQFREFCTNSQILIPELQQALHFAKLTELKKIYPRHQPPGLAFDALGRKLTDLSLVYNITYAANLDIRKFVTELNALEAVEYAQPRMIVTPMYTPNDDSLGLQWYLTKIGAQLAWDLDTGDTNVIIGIVDGGTHFAHQDLSDNVAYNYADPLDGVDNDNDGFIDNFRGWDVGQGDNNPQFFGGPLNSAHGTSMCGLAAAGTNDGQGCAGAGFKCHYLPVKMVHNVFGWIAGYEGLVYAADHGCKIINASWGGTSPAPYEQDVVNYVSINKNAQIFAAAGNSNNTVPFYPASYDGVIAVGGTQMNDTKSGNSSYYEHVDLVAPGQGMLEPYDVGYGNGNGTSESSALTSGAAGLIQSYYTNLQPIQIGAIMCQTAYRIDTIPGNAPYINKQGAGRLDMYAAVTHSLKPYIYFNSRSFTDHNDEVIMVGDTVNLLGNMLNVLDTSTAALTAVITDNSPYVTWMDSTLSLGILNTMSFTNINAQPFIFAIQPGCPLNQNVLMKVVYYDGTDTLNTQYFTFIVNRNYYHLTTNQLQTSVTTTGRIGFADNRTYNGLGYRMKNKENNLFGFYWNPMGLMIGKSSTQVSDQTLSAGPLGPCCNWANDADMVALQNIVVNHQSIVSDLEVISEYSDAGAGGNALGVDVKQKVYAWEDSLNDQFLVIEYQFKNNSGLGTGTWYAGLFADFDLPDSLLWNLGANQSYFDTISQAAISQNVAPRYFVGYKILSAGANLKFYANNSDGSAGHQNVYDGFTGVEKFNVINPSIPSNLSSVTDVSQYLGVQFDSLAANGCAVVHFALLIGTSLNDIRNQAILAQAKFDATFNVWTGNGGNSNWQNGANWSQGTIPDFTDHVIIPDTRSGSGFSPVISVADGTVKNIEIRCGGQLVVNPPFKLKVGN
jgi:serine protease